MILLIIGCFLCYFIGLGVGFFIGECKTLKAFSAEESEENK